MSADTTTEAQVEHGAVKKLPFTSNIGYGLGDFGCNLAFSLSTSFLLFYYTDVAGLSAAAVGTMFLVVRLWDAFTDLFAGRVVDSTMTRWGKFRPFLLFGAVPLLFLSFLTFNMPEQLHILGVEGASAGPALLWAYLTYAVLGLLYSMVNIPYGSLASAMTQSVSERAKLAASRSFGAAIGGVFLTYLIAPRISSLQAESKAARAALEANPNDAAAQALVNELPHRIQTVFTQTTLLFILLGTLAFIGTFLMCKEQVRRTSPRISIKATFATLGSNKPLGILCAASLFYLIGVNAVGPATAYYATYILGDFKWMTPISIVNVGIAIVVTPFIPWVIRKIGKKNLFQFCGLFTVVGGVALFFSPMGAVGLALALLAIKGAGATMINTSMWGLEADTVEYGEWKTGERSEGATYAIFSFTRKLTQSIGGALGAWLLAWGGYKAGLDTQPESALTAIRAAIGLVPAAAAIIAMLIFIKYPLTDSLFSKIRDENETRKEAGLSAAH